MLVLLLSSLGADCDQGDGVLIENQSGAAVRIFFHDRVLFLKDHYPEEVIPPGETADVMVSRLHDWPGRIVARREADGEIIFDRVYTRDEASDLDFHIVIVDESELN